MLSELYHQVALPPSEGESSQGVVDKGGGGGVGHAGGEGREHTNILFRNQFPSGKLEIYNPKFDQNPLRIE